MQIDGIERSTWLRIDVLETDDRQLPSLNVDVEARFGSFGGRARAWLERAALHQFVIALEQLEETRTGAATLTAMSPEAFTLTVAIVDRAGHVVVRSALADGAWVHGQREERRLSGACELEAGKLRALVVELRALAEATRVPA